jgi:hypothetical protein
MLHNFLHLNMIVYKEVGHNHAYQFCVKRFLYKLTITNMAMVLTSRLCPTNLTYWESLKIEIMNN